MKRVRFVDQPDDCPETCVKGLPLRSLPDVLISRRATPHFLPEPVSDELVETILNLAAQSPSGYNLQPWRFVVVKDSAQRQALKEAAMGQAKVAEAPIVVVAFGLPDGWKSCLDEILMEGARRGAGDAADVAKTKKTIESFLGSFPANVWLNRHIMIAVTTMMLAAETYGLDTAPMEGFDPAAVRKVCGLPDNAEVVALLAMGFAAKPDKAYGGRLALEEFVHVDFYGRPWIPID